MADLFLLFFSFFSLAIFFLAFRFSKKGSFYSDTLPLTLLGIYVWGDGLVLAPFWFSISLIFLIFGIEISALIRFYVLFLGVRSAYEVVYWLLHQSANNTYRPPLFRSVSWLKAADTAILYQILHTCILVLSLSWLFL